MKKTELTSLLREYVKNNLSPTKAEQDLVTSLYAAFKAPLVDNQAGLGRCAFRLSRSLRENL